MTPEEIAAAHRLIRDRQRCRQTDQVALADARGEVRRFERAIALDDAEIAAAQRRLDEHFTAAAGLDS